MPAQSLIGRLFRKSRFRDFHDCPILWVTSRYRRPKKLKMAMTITTAPTSQIMLFIVTLLRLWATPENVGSRLATHLEH